MKTGIIFSTKNKILNTAKKLFSENNYLAVSMNDIAKRLKLTKASLYYYFTGKTELYKEILDQVFIDYKKALAPAFKEQNSYKRFYCFFNNYLSFSKKEKILIKAINSITNSDHGKINSYIKELKLKMNLEVERLIKKTVKGNDKDYKLLSSLLVGMMDGLLLEYSLFEKNVNINNVTKKIINLLFQKLDLKE